jgi:predicted aminopeptidase
MLYVAGDTSFNESLATAVEEEGLRRWAAASQTPGLLAEYERHRRLTDRFIATVSKRRDQLSALYAGGSPVDQKRAEKVAIFGALQHDFEAEKLKVPEMAAYDRWFASGLNNAGLAATAVYHDLVPAFERILSRSHGDLSVFYRECRKLSRLPSLERQQRLRQLMSMPPSGE